MDRKRETRPDALPPARRRVWLEIEVLLLVLLCLGVYFVRLTSLSIRGEESRWAQVAYEMLASGDFVVPRQQGAPFPDRPPLNSWAMAAISQATGQWNLAVVRLPAVIATLLTTLLIYAYSRRFLSRTGALGAAAAYPTMVLIVQLGRLAESDAVLTLCVSASLLVWHAGYAARWPTALTWCLGYALAACAGLAKGPQGPIYFVGASWCWLAWQRDWRYFFSVSHLAGLVTLAAIIGAWQVPFFRVLGWDDALAVWSEGSTLASRFDYSNPATVAKQLFGYPLELIVCMLPWSPLLVVFASRRCRLALGEAKPYVGFLLTACLVALPTCWLPANSRPRYFMSLFPCVAPLIGLALERSWQATAAGWWEPAWQRFLATNALVMVIAAAVLVMASLADISALATIAQPPALAAVFAVAALALAAGAWLARGGREAWRAELGIMSIAAFVGLVYCGPAMNAIVRHNNQAGAEIAKLKQKLPPEVRLVSYGTVHHLFAYYYGEPIPLEKRPRDRRSDSGAEYFCFSQTRDRNITLPFDWETIAVINCDRYQRADPYDTVVVGRRLADRGTAQRPTTVKK